MPLPPRPRQCRFGPSSRAHSSPPRRTTAHAPPFVLHEHASSILLHCTTSLHRNGGWTPPPSSTLTGMSSSRTGAPAALLWLLPTGAEPVRRAPVASRQRRRPCPQQAPIPAARGTRSSCLWRPGPGLHRQELSPRASYRPSRLHESADALVPVMHALGWNGFGRCAWSARQREEEQLQRRREPSRDGANR